MADNFGLRIGVEGEKEFKNALRDINQSFKVLGSEMNLVASQFDKQDQSIDAVTARNRVLGKEIDAQKEKISTLDQALANATTSFGETDKRTAAWTIQLNNAKAELNHMEKELAGNATALSNTADEFNTAEKQANHFGNEVKDEEKKSRDLSSSLSTLGGHLKSIGSGVAHAAAAGIAAIGAATAAAAAGAFEMGKAALESVDETQKLADVYGMTAEQIQVMRYQGAKLDVDLETMTGAHGKLVKSMNAASNGTKAQSEAFKELGIRVTDSHGKLRDNNTVFNEAVAALGKVKNETERNALAMTIFGKSAMELNPLIKAGSAELKSLSDEAYKSGAVISNAATDGLDKFGDSTEALKLSVMGLAGTALAGLLPQLNGVLDGMKGLAATGGEALKTGDWSAFGTEVTTVIQGLVGQISGFLPGFIKVGTSILTSLIGAVVAAVPQVLPPLIAGLLTLVNAIADTLTSQGPTLITVAINAIGSLALGILQALPQIAQAAIAIILALVDGLIANLPSLIVAAVQAVAALATGIAQALPVLIPAIIQAIVIIVQTLLTNLGPILDAALQIILGLVNGILAALPQLIAALPQIILAIVDFIIQAIPQIIDAGIQLLTSLIGALPVIITAIVQAIPLIINGIITAVINAIPMLIDAGINLLVSLIKALPQIIVMIVKAIPQIIFGIVNAVVGNIDKIIMAGVQLFMSLIQNLPTIIVEIVKAVPQIITGIVDAFGSYFSKLAEAGGNLLKGLWQGISDAGQWLWDKISSFFGDIVQRIKDFFGIHSPSTLFASFGGNLAMGLGLGFGKEMNRVAQDMQNAIPVKFNAPDISLSAAGSSLQGTSLQAPASITYIFQSPKALDEATIAANVRREGQRLQLALQAL